MKVLTLDLATSTGYAINSEPWTSGTWDLSPRRGESPGIRFLRLLGRLNEVLAAHPDLALVAYEQPLLHHKGGASGDVAKGLVAHVQSWCAQHNIQHTAVAAATLKRHATGKGNSPKEAMVEAALKRGWKPGSDDEADALHLLDLVLTRGV